MEIEPQPSTSKCSSVKTKSSNRRCTCGKSKSKKSRSSPGKSSNKNNMKSKRKQTNTKCSMNKPRKATPEITTKEASSYSEYFNLEKRKTYKTYENRKLNGTSQCPIKKEEETKGHGTETVPIQTLLKTYEISPLTYGVPFTGKPVIKKPTYPIKDVVISPPEFVPSITWPQNEPRPPENKFYNYPKPCVRSESSFKWLADNAYAQQKSKPSGQSLLRPQDVGVNDELQDDQNLTNKDVNLCTYITQLTAQSRYKNKYIKKPKQSAEQLKVEKILNYYDRFNSEPGIEDINLEYYNRNNKNDDVFDTLTNLCNKGIFYMEMVQCKICNKWGPRAGHNNHYILTHASKPLITINLML